MKGVHGLRLNGLDAVAQFLVEAPPGWPTLTVECAGGTEGIERTHFDESLAEFKMRYDGGQIVEIRIERASLAARFTSEADIENDQLVHPGLAIVASVTAHWLGRDAFHAGAFLIEGGAWAILGAQEAGKSTTLGHLFAHGADIVTDDILVVHNGLALAGPRSIDLREGAAEWLGIGDHLTRSHKSRVRTAQIPSSAPLHGFVLPCWGDEVRLTPVPVAERLPLLFANRALTKVEPAPERLLDLAMLPFLRFERPRRWESMDQATGLLLERVSQQT